MASHTFRRQFFESSRGRIVGLLRRGGHTVDEIASALDLTDNAVRVQLAAMERDGLVRRSGLRRGATRPAHLYELTPELEHLLSGAYVPLLHQLVRAVAERESVERFDALMRQAGRGLATELPMHIPDGPLELRVAAASQLLNQELGALTEVETPDGHYVIRGHGCPLAALTGKQPGVCHAIESLLAQLLQTRVHECCDRGGQPRCCFEIFPPPGPRGAGAARARRS
jgi:DeoR family transcriptional regulator, suf operon transcriptional repressor